MLMRSDNRIRMLDERSSNMATASPIRVTFASGSLRSIVGQLPSGVTRSSAVFTWPFLFFQANVSSSRIILLSAGLLGRPLPFGLTKPLPFCARSYSTPDPFFRFRHIFLLE